MDSVTNFSESLMASLAGAMAISFAAIPRLIGDLI